MGLEIVKLGGTTLDRDDAVRPLRANDAYHTELVVAELKRDGDGEGASVALSLVAKAFYGQIVGFLSSSRFCDGWFHQYPALIDEAWNEALYRVYDRIESFDSSLWTLRQWFFRQACWTAMDIRRREVRQLVRQIPLAELSDEEDRTIEPVPEPLTRRELEALERAFERLTPTERKLVVKRFLLGFQPVEIAREDAGGAFSEETIRVYVYRAKWKCQRLYKEELARVGVT